MEIIIKIKETTLLLRREELDWGGGPAEPLIERQVMIQDEQMGLITDTQITTGNFFMSHCELRLTQPIELVKDVEDDIIQLDFALRGESQVQPGGGAERQCFASGQHNICYIPRSKSLYAYSASEQPLDYSVVLIPREVYFRLLPSGSELHRQFVRQIRQQKAGYSTPKNPPITPAMAWLLREMRVCPRTGSLKRLFLEARILELLMLQLEQLQAVTSLALPLKTADIRKIREARELLDTCYVNPPTIIELAKLVGLNEFKLKRGFREETGTTILGYITKMRMEEAKRWLMEGEKTISEISYWVGYKNPSHFTVAFKHYYGRLPSAFRLFP